MILRYYSFIFSVPDVCPSGASALPPSASGASDSGSSLLGTSITEAIESLPRRLITLTPCVARPAKRMSPTGMRIVSPERLMIIRSFSSVTALIAISLPVFSVI